MQNQWIAALRLLLLTALPVLLLYLPWVWIACQACFPDQAAGSLVRRLDGAVTGSLLLAQASHDPGYFWPRPSAVGHQAAAGGGSNHSPANPALRRRAEEQVALHGATSGQPLPAELACASGSGLDPHLSPAAARFQCQRIAAHRSVSPSELLALVDAQTRFPGRPVWNEGLLNVLELNLALDRLFPRP